MAVPSEGDENARLAFVNPLVNAFLHHVSSCFFQVACLWDQGAGGGWGGGVSGWREFRIRNHRVGSVSQSSVLNQHPKVRISIAETASKTILDQHCG